MSRVIHAQFVITDYDEDDPLRLEDLRSNIKHTLGHARDDIEFYFETDEGFMRCVKPEGEVLDSRELDQLQREVSAFPTDGNVAGLWGGYVANIMRRLLATVVAWRREAWRDVPDGSDDQPYEEPGDCPLCGAPRGEACDGGLHG